MTIGVLGIGVYLPPAVRTNAWWPPEIVARWTAARSSAAVGAAGAPPPATDGESLVLAAMREHAADPFHGAVERRVIADDESSIDLEVRACDDALARAGVPRDAVDVLFTYTAVPDYLVNNGACLLHHRLGLRRDCFVVSFDATGYSFVAQLELAERWMADGRARCALLVQSSAMTRILAQDDPHSPVFGDGATAVVVGPVRPGRGVLGSVNRAWTEHPLQLVASPPGRRWYDDGRAYLHTLDLEGSRQVFFAIADQARDAIGAVLAHTGVTPGAVDFFAAHQGTPWLRQVAQTHAGLTNARTYDGFPDTASLFAANLPYVLRVAEDRGLLAPDDLVLIFGGGTGVVYGATLVRWGAA